MRSAKIGGLLILLVQNQPCWANVLPGSGLTSSASALSTHVGRPIQTTQPAIGGEEILGIQNPERYHGRRFTELTPAEEKAMLEDDSVPPQVIQESEELKKKWTDRQDYLAATTGKDHDLPSNARYRDRGAWEWFIQEAFISESGKEMVTVSLVTGFNDVVHDVAWSEVWDKDLPGLSTGTVAEVLREKKKEWRKTHQEKLSSKEKEQRARRKKQGFVNLALGDGGPGCRVKPSASNHLYFYHPVLDSTLPEIQESFLYEITTPWKLTYPKQLRKALRAMGFKMVAAPKECSPQHTWSHLFDVEAEGVRRGRVDMKFPRGSSARNISLYDDQWEMIEDVLEQTFPELEIAMVIFGSIGLAAVLLVVGTCMMRRCAWNARPKVSMPRPKKIHSPEDDCVELRDTQEHGSVDTAHPDLP